MKRWWIGVALTAGWLGLHVPAWGQAPMPEPLPYANLRPGSRSKPGAHFMFRMCRRRAVIRNSGAAEGQ